MADLIKNSEPSAPEPNKSGKITGVIFVIFALLCGLIFLATKSLIALALCVSSAIVSLVAFSAGSSLSSRTPESKRYGNMGERKVGSILQNYLPDDYTVIQNTKISYGGGTSEIDNIVIGKTGVFVIEVKNMKGSISGNYEEKKWIKDKTDPYDIEHTTDFYNPVKQVGTHIYRLANYLRDNKVFTYINGAVYFANPQSKVKLEGEPKGIPVFTYKNTKEMIDYIRSGSANLSDRTVEKIINILKNK